MLEIRWVILCKLHWNWWSKKKKQHTKDDKIFIFENWYWIFFSSKKHFKYWFISSFFFIRWPQSSATKKRWNKLMIMNKTNEKKRSSRPTERTNEFRLSNTKQCVIKKSFVCSQSEKLIDYWRHFPSAIFTRWLIATCNIQYNKMLLILIFFSSSEYFDEQTTIFL